MKQKESKNEQSEVYLKTISTFESHIGKEEAKQLAERIDRDLKKIKEGIGNPMLIIRSLGDAIYGIKKNIINQEIINTLNQLQDSLSEFLNQYAKPEDAIRIAKGIILKVNDELQPTKRFYELNNGLELEAKKQLNALPARKKIIEPIAFSIEFSKIFNDFEQGIKEQYDDLNNDLFEILLESIPEELSGIESQIDEIEKVKRGLSELIRKELQPHKAPYAQLYQYSQQRLFLEAKTRGMSVSESIDYVKSEHAKEMEPSNKKIEEVMDSVLARWSEDKPAEIISMLGFSMIKTMIKLELTSEHVYHSLQHSASVFTASATQVTLQMDELILSRQNFRHFLHEAHANKLFILCREKLCDMDVKNLHLDDAKNNFFYLINSLPNESQAILADEHCTQEQIESLDLSVWHPTRITLSLLSNKALIAETTEYACLYEAHCQQLAKEQKLEEKQSLLEKANRTLEPGILSTLVYSIKKSNTSQFNFFIKKGSLATLQAVLDKVSSPDFKSKDDTISQKLINDLKSHLGDLRLARYSAPSNAYAFSPSSPVYGCRTSSELPLESDMENGLTIFKRI